MAVYFSPEFNDQTFDANGNPAVGYKLFTYVSGSTTKQTTYTDSTGLVAQTNPIILNASGYPTNGSIWLTGNQTYKFVLAPSTDTDPPTSPVKTIDGIKGVNDSSSSNTQWVSAGVTPTYISATGFSLVGDQTTEFHVGRRLQFTVTAGTVYGTITASTFGAITTVTVATDSGILDSGLSNVNLSILRNDNPALPIVAYGCNRNRIDNSNFQINQLVVSGAVVLAAGATGHDRWKAGAAGCSYTFATSGKDTTITISAGSLMQVIEDKDVEGGVYRLSHAGTAQARIAVNGAATSGAYAAAPLTSASATGGLAMTVEFSTGTVSKVQLEPGTMVTNYERRPYRLDLAICQRCICKTFLPTVAPAQNAGLAGALLATTFAAGGGGVTWKYPVEMRATPTITSYNPSAANSIWRDVTNSVDRAAAASNATGTTQADILLAASAAAPAFNYIHLLAQCNL